MHYADINGISTSAKLAIYDILHKMGTLHLTKIKPGVAQSRVFRTFANRMAIRFHAHFRHDCISKLAGVGLTSYRTCHDITNPS